MTGLGVSLKQYNQTFWAAIITELLHCLASYCMMAYLVIYLAKDLGFGDVRANVLISALFFMGYFLPILIGAIADRYGFRQTMVVSLVIITIGYFLASKMVRFPSMLVALMVIALGGAVMKPVIAGTVKAASTKENRTLGFSIYYMVINIGAFLGPFLSNGVRTWTHHSAYVLTASGVVETSAFLVTLFMFRNLPVAESAKSKSFLTVINEMVIVLGNLRLFITVAGLASVWIMAKRSFFTSTTAWAIAAGWIVLNFIVDIPLRNGEKQKETTPQLLQPQRFGDIRLLLFILIFSGVWALYSQIFTNIPLFITRIQPSMKAHIEYFQAVDPIMIVILQVFIGKWMSRFRALPAMIMGIIISAAAVGSVGILGHALGAWAVGISLAVWSIGEMMFSPRSVEYVSVIAPKEKLALYIGYGFLPMAFGLGFGPIIGGQLVTFFAKIKHPDWVWGAFAAWALVIALALWAFDAVIERKTEADNTKED